MNNNVFMICNAIVRVALIAGITLAAIIFQKWAILFFYVLLIAISPSVTSKKGDGSNADL